MPGILWTRLKKFWVREEEKKMREITFKSSGVETITPVTTPRGVLIRTAVAQLVPAGKGVYINTGLSCDVPLLVTFEPGLLGRGLKPAREFYVVPPGARIDVLVENSGSLEVQLAPREVVLVAYPLQVDDFTVRHEQ